VKPIEIKLSRNPKLVKGYTRQLEAYKTAEETRRGYYLVIDVGEMGTKDQKLIETKNRAAKNGDRIANHLRGRNEKAFGE